MPELKTLADLRGELFETLAALRDKENPMEIARAKAVANIAQAIINSAKTEVAYLKASGMGDRQIPFLDGAAPTLPPPKPDAEQSQKSGVTVRRHVLR